MKTVQIVFLAGLPAIGVVCSYSKHTTPPQVGTMPAITQVSPKNANAGAAFTLTANGSNFASNAAVNFNGVAQMTTHASASQLTAAIPGLADMNSGTVPVTVTNPGPGGLYGVGTLPETSAPMNFTITSYSGSIRTCDSFGLKSQVLAVSPRLPGQVATLAHRKQNLKYPVRGSLQFSI